jgi:AraC-like DNA-binding protein
MDVSDVALALGFASPDALRKLIRRTLGVSVLAVSDGGFFDAVCGEIRRGLPGGGEAVGRLRLVR